MSNFKDGKRLEDLIEALHISKHKFSVELGYKAPASVYHVIEGLNSLSPGMRDRILTRYPNVNEDYLKKGELPILLPAEQVRKKQNSQDVINDFNLFKEFASIPKKLDRIIELLENQ